MTFLIVDDSRTARNLVKNYINEIKTEHTYNFVEAESAEAALVALQTNRIDFIFLDWNLSTKMTGLDALKEIRAIEKYKKVPIFMITSEGDKIHVIEALKCGATDFIVKPVDPKIFEPKVFKLIFTLK